MEKTKQMRWLEQLRGREVEELICEGLERGLSWGELARELDVSLPTVRNWMLRLGIQVKTHRRIEREAKAATS